MATLTLGLFLLVCAAVSLWDAARITSRLRLPGVFDVVGPDRYLMGAGLFIGVLGLCFVADWARTALKAQKSEVRMIAANRLAFDEGTRRCLWLVAGLVAYVAVMPVAGYILSTLVFGFVIFRLMGVADPLRACLSTLVMTASFYAAFVKLADMPLPAGLLGIG